MKTHPFKKALALMLTLLLIGTCIPLAASAVVSSDAYSPTGDFYLISDTKYNIAPGITENRIITNKTSGTQQETVYAVTVDLSAGSTAGVMAAFNDCSDNLSANWQMSSVRYQAAKAAEKTGRNIVAAFNADIYNMQTGEPTGPLVIDGRVHKAALGHPYFGITKDGKPVMGNALTQEVLDNLQQAAGGFYTLIENGERTPIASQHDEYVAPHTAVGLKADGSLVFMCIDGRNYPISNSCDNYDLTTILLDLGCVEALNFDGGGSTTYLAKYEGTDALVLANHPSDSVERKVASSILIYSNARPSGEFDHASLTPNNTLYTPNSIVEFTATGVDSAGGAAELPADGVFALADDSFGTIDPATGLFTANDTTGVVTVNFVSGGAVVGSTDIEIVTPDELYIPSEEYSLDFDETTDFGLVAKNAGRDVIIKDGDIIWTAVDEGGNNVTTDIGAFEGLTFTARSEGSAEATVTAVSAYDEAIIASTKAVIGAAPVMLYDFEYTTDQAEAEASEGKLQWIPTYDLPIYDNKNKPGGRTHSEMAEEWRQQGYPLYGWPNASLDVSAMQAKIVSRDDEGEQVRFGDHALRMDVDFSSYNGDRNSNNYLRVTSPTYRFEGSPKKMSAWVYCPEGMSNFCLYLNLCNKDNGITYAPISIMNGSTATNWVGWRYVEIDLSTPVSGSTNISPTSYPYGFYQGCGVFWLSFQPGVPNGTRSASTVYLDNIQLIYSSNTDDTKNPEVTSITYDTPSAPEEFVNNTTVLTDGTVTIRASYKDAEDKYMTGIDANKVSMAIDGVDVTDKCFINEGDEQIYLYDAQLNDGVHSVSVTVYDNFGNKTTETRYFTVDASAPATAELIAEQDNPILGSSYSLGIKAADAADVAGAEIAVHTFAAFTYFYDDVTVVPAEGYALDGEAKYDSTNAIISFKLVKDGSAVPEDGIIAHIVYNIPSNVRSDSIAVRFRVDKGQISYATEKDEKYLGSFGGSVSTECIAPLVLTSETFLVGEGGYFIVTDLDGNPVEGAIVVLSDGTPVAESETDADGMVYSEMFMDSVQKFTVRAEKDGLISFYYTTQSYPCAANEDGSPSFIVLNGAKDGSTMINLSWFSNPSTSTADAVVKYATAAAYEANGDEALQTVTGASRLVELASNADINDNRAIRFNKALISGLSPETEYVYMVGDGERMSDLRTFKTGKMNVDTSFFIIGDMQEADNTNLNAILDALQNADTPYNFGIQTGDAVDNGGQFRWWQSVAAVFSDGYLSTRPIIHTLGNHEYYGDFSGENSADYFGMETEDNAAPLAYSAAYGNVYAAIINYADSSAKNYRTAIDWVKADAANSNATWKILVMHQPSYYTNPGGSNDVVNELIPPMVDEVGFDFVFSGHDHSYARTEPLTNGAVDTENGAVYYICGSTGEKSYQVVDDGRFPFAFVRGSQAVEGEYNAIYMTAHTTDSVFVVETHDVTVAGDGTYTDDIIDSYTMTKAVTCTESGEHDFAYADGALVCTVCGYSKPIDNYTGFAKDAETGRTRYFINGEVQTGWLFHGEDVYYFDENGIAISGGKHTINGIEYEFTEDGRQAKVAFHVVPEGYTRGYWGDGYITGWKDIDGKTYHFIANEEHPGKMLTGRVKIQNYNGQGIVYHFADDGHLLDYVWVEEEGGKRYYWAQTPQTGWVEIEGKQYYFDPSTAFMQTGVVTIDGETYSFDDSGALIHKGLHADENGDHLCDTCGKYVSTNNSKVSSILEPILTLFFRILAKIRTFFQSTFAKIANIF
ncbi:MAG: phosphodiester glycosidase family protein [Clostridia bacterium]|nr:phosphodiester glycosidase family protein [Clostridia bacterium]